MTAYTLKQASSLLQSKQISAVELATEYLAAIAVKNPAVNGYVTIDQDKTLAEAKAADARIAAGNATALTGVPVAYKDIFCQTGWRSACSSKMLDNFVSPYTATVVQNLLDAGMVTLGRTNMDDLPWVRLMRLRSTAQPKTHGILTCSRWFVRRFGCRDCSAFGTGCVGFGYRRFYPSACVTLRHYRHQTDLRYGFTFRYGCLCFQL